MLKSFKHKKGVTMMEMLVVMAIIAMLSLIAMPTFFGFTKNARLKGAARVISSALRNARSYAIIKRINYTVTIYLTDNAVSIYETPDNVKKINMSDTGIIDVRNYDGSTTIGSNQDVTFKPDGTTTLGANTSVRVYDVVGTGTTNVHYIEIKVYYATGSVKTGDIDEDI